MSITFPSQIGQRTSIMWRPGKKQQLFFTEKKPISLHLLKQQYTEFVLNRIFLEIFNEIFKRLMIVNIIEMILILRETFYCNGNEIAVLFKKSRTKTETSKSHNSCIQNPVKHLQGCLWKELLTVVSHQLFSQKVSS